MKKIIHINQHIIKKNAKTGTREPVITVKTYKSNDYGHEVIVLGPCKIKYRPDKPLSCGAHVWIESHSEVIVTQNNSKSVSRETVKKESYRKNITDFYVQDACGKKPEEVHT